MYSQGSLFILKKIKKLREISIIIGFILLISTGYFEMLFNEARTIKDLGLILLLTIPSFSAGFINSIIPFKGKIKYPFLIALPFFAIAAGYLCGNRAFTAANSILWLYICSGITYKKAVSVNIFIVIFYLFLDYKFMDYELSTYIDKTIFLNGASVFGFISSYIQYNIQKELNRQHKIAVDSAREREDKLEYKTGLYAGLAHEVKTPLTIIRHYFSRYRLNNKDSMDLQILQDNLDKLERLIVNFLKFEKDNFVSKVSSVDHPCGSCSLSILIEKNKTMLTSYFKRKNVELSFNVDPGVVVGLTQIDCEHIFLNLIENALRYTPSGGVVSVRLFVQAGNIVLRVQDNGIGISAEYLDKIFEPYNQVRGISSSKQGLGLGLPIVKNIVTLSGGAIDVESVPGNGSTFTVTLPVYNKTVHETEYNLILPINAATAQAADNLEEKKFSDNMKYKVILVEDNDDLRIFLEEYLSKEYDVLSFENGQKVLAGIDKNNMPDIIISDVYMDEMDGLTLLDSFLEQFPKHPVPFVFISADDTQSLRIKSLKMGAIDYIIKPFSPKELELKISTWISLFSQNKTEEIMIIRRLTSEYKLSNREAQFSLLLLQGVPRKIISEKLFISLNTVKTHLGSIYSKCGVGNKDEFKSLIERIT